MATDQEHHLCFPCWFDRHGLSDPQNYEYGQPLVTCCQCGRITPSGALGPLYHLSEHCRCLLSGT